MSDAAEQLSLFVQDSCAGKMSLAHSAQGSRNTRTSASSSRRSAELKAIPYLFLDLTPGHGDLLGLSSWELRSPWRGECSMLNTGASPNEDRASFLFAILEVSPPRKYYLSRKACLGILRRSEKRGKPLPESLKLALELQSGVRRLGSLRRAPRPPLAFHINQREETIDLGETAGALMATANMQMQTFVSQVAAFNAGAGPGARGIGYSEEVAPTLKAAQSGNMMPAVLCLDDQGGRRMECSGEITGTLRAQCHGHEPLVLATQQGGAEIGEGVCPTITAAAGMSGNNQPVLFENYGLDARYRGPLEVAPTVSAAYGTGGNNVPLVAESETTVFSRQRVDLFCENDVVSTESARQHKDATDLVLQKSDTGPAVLLIRRLTPLECERLQGFPDHWTDLPKASDSARYKALGNSVAVPCVEYIMQGIARVLEDTSGT